MGIPSSKGLNPTWSCWAGRDKHQELKFPPEPTWRGRKLEGVIQGQPGWTLLFYGINSSPGSATRSQTWGAAKPRALHSLFFPQEKGKSEEKFPFLPSIRAKSHLPGMGTGLSWWEAEILHKYPFLNVYFTVPHLNFNFQNILQYLRNWDSSNVGFYT